MKKPEEIVDAFIATLKNRAYGNEAGRPPANNQWEGDYGKWDDWKKALVEFANLCIGGSDGRAGESGNKGPDGKILH
jgi:hypothetical protein